MMKGYLIANLDVQDQPTFQRYREQVLPLIARFGGRYIIRGGDVQDVEGNLGLKRLIVLEFPNIEAARAFYECPEYQPIKALRLQSAESEVALVVGYDDA
jgi:uncharacterized protein (DUF1330 family)